MRIGVPQETLEGERRVALIPDAVKSLPPRSIDVVVESGAGVEAGSPDEEYTEAGAEIGDPPGAPTSSSTSPSPPARRSASSTGPGPDRPPRSAHRQDTKKALASAGVTSFAVEAIPRITRAQAMDALSSQANVAGYAAALLAAREAGRFFPMMTTAAGTVKPARVLVLGAGVAGLQAIATAHRLGAVVSGFDIRRAAWEQISSLGGRPLELDFIPDAEDEGGYARPAHRRGERAGPRGARRERRQAGRDHHDRPDPRPRRADPDQRRRRPQHGAGLGDHRPRRRQRRQLRADEGGGDRRPRTASR